VTTRITASDDDAEEAVPGSTAGSLAVGDLYNSSSDIELGFDSDKYTGNQYIGLRFPGVAVPKNVYVHRAHVAFVVDAVGDCCNETFEISVKMQKVANAPSFAGKGSSYLHGLYTGNATSGMVTYSPAKDEAVGDAATTADLSALVQEVVGQPGWASGNAMVVLFGGSTGTTEAHSREYESFDGASGSAPALVIEYCPVVTTSCPGGASPGVATARVAALADDVEEAMPGATAGSVAVGELYSTSSDIELGYDKDKYEGKQYVGLRFDGVGVPAGATVQDARIKFWVDAAGSCCDGDLNVTVKMQKAANAAAFAGQSSGYLHNLYTSGATGAEVTYTPQVDTASDVHQPRYTANLKDAVQEVLGVSGWASGNAMAALIAPSAGGSTEANSREYESFDTDPNYAASMYVVYCPSSGTASTTAAVSTTAAPSAATVCPDGSSPSSVTTRITASDDDAEEAVPGSTAGSLAVGDLYNSSSDIELGFDSDKYTGNQYIGLRFPGVAVPKNVYVHRAHVAFVVDAVGDCCNETFEISVKMQKVANAPSFAGKGSSYLHGLYTGNATSGMVTYSPAKDEAVGDAATTADLSALVQEVVGQPGWASGNAMVVLFGGSTGTTEAHSREYESFDGASGSAPALVIEYCPVVTTSCPGGASPGVATARVAALADDVEEAMPGATAGSVAVGELYSTSSDIELGYDKDKYEGKQYVGLRFDGVGVPAGATVQDARIKFWVDAAGSCCDGDLNVTVKMQKAANAAAFAGQSSGYLHNLYTSGATGAEVTYTPQVDTASDVHQPRYTANLKDAVQEVLGVSGWASGNAMAALIAPSAGGSTEANSREYESFDTDPNYAASMYVVYCPSSGTASTTAIGRAAADFAPSLGTAGSALALLLVAVGIF